MSAQQTRLKSLLVVTQDFPPEIGGIQRYAHALSREFGRQLPTIVVAPGRIKNSGDVGEPYKAVRYPWPHTSFFGFSTVVSEPLLALTAKTRVAFHAQYATAIGSYVAKRLRLIDRYYIAAHAMEIKREHFGPVHLAWRDRVLKDADAIFAVSNYTAHLVRQRGVAENRIEVVPNGVDLDRFSPRDTRSLRHRLNLKSRKVILAVARLVERKGVDTLIEAFRSIADRHPDTVLIVVGDGPDRQRLLAQAAALVQQGRVYFAGRVEDAALPGYYSLADVVTLPSRVESNGSVEGFGLVFLEANACGTTVIGSRSGGIPDAVADGVSGLLVEPGSAIDLARALDRLLADNELRLRLAAQGLNRAKQFTWKRAAERMLERMAADQSSRVLR